MRLRGGVALLLSALALAGCGGAGRDAGTATLWVTRDRGAVVMLETTVPAGQTVLRALHGEAKVETRYGGRYVQGIDGVQGSLVKRRDWFWFVNGQAGDRSAAEYRLHDGDVAWWDYRDWSHDADLPVVAGAFPEPFVHGFDGQVRQGAVVYGRPGDRAGAAAIAHVLHVTRLYRSLARVPAGWNVFVLTGGPTSFHARQRVDGGPGSPVLFTYSGDVRKLLDGAYRRRFSVP